jgi:hypothetical protein
LGGKPEENRPLGRPTHRRKNNFKMDFKEIGREAWAELIGCMKGTSGELIQFCKVLGVS